MQHVINPDMPWNEEIRVGWARHDRLAASPRTVALLLPLTSELDVRAVLPTIACQPWLSITQTTQYSCPREARISLITYRARSTWSCPGATCITSLNRDGVRPSTRSANSLPANRVKWPMIGYSPRCCSATSWTRRVGRRRSATVTGGVARCARRRRPGAARRFAAAR